MHVDNCRPFCIMCISVRWWMSDQIKMLSVIAFLQFFQCSLHLLLPVLECKSHSWLRAVTGHCNYMNISFVLTPSFSLDFFCPTSSSWSWRLSGCRNDKKLLTNVVKNVLWQNVQHTTVINFSITRLVNFGLRTKMSSCTINSNAENAV